MSTPGTLRAALAAATLVGIGLFAGPAHAVNSCGGITHAPNACGGGNIYPCCQPSNGNCTWWAWEAACRNWGIAFTNWNDANKWAGHARTDPRVDVIGSPQVGSIATSTIGYAGHVAWVESFGGSAVTVSQEACHQNGSNGSYAVVNYSQSYFNSGYVVPKGSSCGCDDGDTQTEACSCGTRTRTCHGCSWGAFSACEGVPEVCDGVDNDCNGRVDDGHPQKFGPVLPQFAATLVDSSYPPTLNPGEHAFIWADFRNTGASAWTKGGIWLGARGAADGPGDAGVVGSALAPGTWPAWNVAATLDQPVAPGDVARFSFEVVGPDQPGADIAETFQLQVAGGAFIACPTADITPRIQVLPGGRGNAGVGVGGAGGGAGGGPATTANTGCSAAGSGESHAGLALLSLAALALARTRRRAAATRR